MAVNRKDYNFATCLVKYLMIEVKDWKPHLNFLYKDKGPLNVRFQEKVKHTLSYTSLDVKYRSWFQNRKPNVENFKRLADLVTSNYSQRSYSDEEFLNYSIGIGILGLIGYLDDIPKAPDYAIICIIYVLGVFRENGQFRSGHSLNFMRWIHGDIRRTEKLSLSFRNTCSSNIAPNSPQKDLSQEPISSGIESDCSSVFEKLKIDSDNEFRSKFQNSFQNMNNIIQNNRTFPTHSLEKVPRYQINFGKSSSHGSCDQETDKEGSENVSFFLKSAPLKRPVTKLDSGIADMNFQVNEMSQNKNLCSWKNEYVTEFDFLTNCNEPSTSGASSNEMVKEPDRRLHSNPTTSSQISIQRDLKPDRRFLRSKSEHFVRIENKSNEIEGNPDNVFSSINEVGLKTDSSTSRVRETVIVLHGSKRHMNIKRRSSTEKTKLHEFSSPEKVNMSSNPKPVKRLKSISGNEFLDIRHATIKRTLSV